MHKLNITSLVTKSLDDKEDFVKRVEFDYSYTEEIGDKVFVVSTSSFILLDEVSDSYTPFDELSEEQVKQWVLEKADFELLDRTLDSKMNVFRNVDSLQIEDKKPLPWSNK